MLRAFIAFFGFVNHIGKILVEGGRQFHRNQKRRFAPATFDMAYGCPRNSGFFSQFVMGQAFVEPQRFKLLDYFQKDARGSIFVHPLYPMFVMIFDGLKRA